MTPFVNRCVSSKFGAIGQLIVALLLPSLTSCAVLDYVFDEPKVCKAGQHLVSYVEIATEVVQARCLTEGQLDVLRQDTTVRIIGVGPVVTIPNQDRRKLG